MKIVKYECDECKGQIANDQFLEIASNDPEMGFSIRNNFDGAHRQMSNWSEMHFCSKDCLVTMFFGKSKKICEPRIEVGVDYTNFAADVTEFLSSEPEIVTESQAKVFALPDEITEDLQYDSKVDTPKANMATLKPDTSRPKRGWPKGKPREKKENEAEHRISEVKPEAVPAPEPKPRKVPGPQPTTKDVFEQKLQFAKSLGYETLAAALVDMDRYAFDKQFAKSSFSK